MPRNMEFKTVFDEYHPKIIRYLTRMVGADDAEDVAQEVFDKVHRGLQGFQGESRLSTWIYRIATNAAIDRTRSASYKHEKERKPLEDAAANGSSSLPESPPIPMTDQLVIRKEMSDCINEYIDALPPDYRTVLVLSDLEGLANKEIAEILGISTGNVKIRLHRARTRLKKALEVGCDFYYNEENTLACDRKQVQILPKPPK
jgi:RNA polymerase sigma-70 factor (ECF subfamily)